jgi:uncharacterized protein
MFKEEKEIKEDKIINKIIMNGKFMNIALCRDNQTYIVTLSYGYDLKNNCFYYHCANKGYKLDIIKLNPFVCATIVEDHGYVDNDCSHKYRSLVIWGKLRIVEDMDEKIHGFDVLFNHLEKKSKDLRSKIIDDKFDYDKVCVLRLEIDSIDAKGNI